MLTAISTTLLHPLLTYLRHVSLFLGAARIFQHKQRVFEIIVWFSLVALPWSLSGGFPLLEAAWIYQYKQLDF